MLRDLSHPMPRIEPQICVQLLRALAVQCALAE
jgi:hypothetical protein